MRLLHSLVTTLFIILNSAEFSLQVDPYNNPYYIHNQFPNHNQNDDQNHNHNHNINHNAYPNQHQFNDHNQFSDHSQIGDHNPFAVQDPYAHQHQHTNPNNYPQLYPGSSSGGHAHFDNTGYSSSVAYQGGHSSSVQPTYHAAPPIIEHPELINRIEVKFHNSQIFHYHNYPDIILRYKQHDLNAGLKYAERQFPLGYYRISEDGKRFIAIPHKEEVTVLISVPDMYVLGVLELSAPMDEQAYFTFYGLYADYVGKMLRVTRPPADDHAEMMLIEEKAVLEDKRIFLTPPPVQRRRRA